MKHILSTILLAGTLAAAAQSPAVNDAVAVMAAKCPYNYREGWILQSVTAGPDKVTLKFNVSLPPAYYQAMKAGGDGIKPMWLGNMNGYGDDWKRMVRAAAESGSSLEMHLSSASDPDGFSVTFTPDDLRGVY